MLSFKPCLKRQAGPRAAAFEPHCVGDNSLDARNMNFRIPLAGYRIAVGIDADCRVPREAPPSQRLVEQDPRGCIDGREHARSHHFDINPKAPQRLDQCPGSYVASASFSYIERNRGDELKKAHFIDGGCGQTYLTL